MGDRIELNEFHWTDGWYFRRGANGAVHVRHNDEVQIVIPAAEWCSIVHAVAPLSADYHEILRMHTMRSKRPGDWGTSSVGHHGGPVDD